MKLSICITTRNRPQTLDLCLKAVWSSTVAPASVIVSDDSADTDMQAQNRAIVQLYPGTTFITGPRSGVCGNRNHAVNAVVDSDFVAFVDDDVCLAPDFIAKAIACYETLSQSDRAWTIFTGTSRDQNGHELLPGKLTFRGYFQPTDTPESVVIHAAIFPRVFFHQEQWDENIFFGYEDAELCLRALKRGYRIVRVPGLQVANIGFEQGSLAQSRTGNLTDYELYVEAARLYVGVKRYRYLFPNAFKLLSFLSIYFTHLTFYLLKRRSIDGLPEIVKRSRVERLWRSA